MTVGERFKAQRVKARLTQQELAEATGLSKGGIYQIESGRRLPSYKATRKIARALGVEVGQLFDDHVPEMHGFYCPVCGAMLEVRDAHRDHREG